MWGTVKDSNHGSPLIPSLGFVYSERCSAGTLIICHETTVGMMTAGVCPSQIWLEHEWECIQNKGGPTVEWTLSVCVFRLFVCLRKGEWRHIDKCLPCTILREMSRRQARVTSKFSRGWNEIWDVWEKANIFIPYTNNIPASAWMPYAEHKWSMCTKNNLKPKDKQNWKNETWVNVNLTAFNDRRYPRRVADPDFSSSESSHLNPHLCQSQPYILT